MPSPLVRQVRRWFNQVASGDLEGFLAEVPADAVWEPSGSPRPLVGPAQLRAYLEHRMAGGGTGARVYGFEQVGSCVLASGSLREARDAGLVEQQLTWLYVFDEGGRLRRASHFASVAEARAAAGGAASAVLTEPGAADRPGGGPPASSP